MGETDSPVESSAGPSRVPMIRVDQVVSRKSRTMVHWLTSTSTTGSSGPIQLQRLQILIPAQKAKEISLPPICRPVENKNIKQIRAGCAAYHREGSTS